MRLDLRGIVDILEFLVLVDDLDAVVEIGGAVLAHRGKVAVNRHFVRSGVGAVHMGRSQGGIARGHRRGLW